ncbi:HAD family hydrolase [Bacillus timonensis]|nr:HAD family hydrolase [Bacillus timonensis]
MIKLIVSDLDGTLLPHDKVVSQQDQTALKHAVSEGIDICLASGRSDFEIVEVLKSLDDKYHRISQNGAYILTNDSQEIHTSTFHPQLAEQIFNEIPSTNFVTLVCNFDTNYTTDRNEHILKLEERMFKPIVEHQGIHGDMESVKPSKITVLGDEEEILSFQKNMNKRFSEHIDTFISEKQCLDIMPKNISKGNALRVLIEKLGYEPEEIACIGDSFNDIPMFKLTPHSFAMETAHEDVKKQASTIVASVSEAVEYVLKINRSQKLTR